MIFFKFGIGTGSIIQGSDLEIINSSLCTMLVDTKYGDFFPSHHSKGRNIFVKILGRSAESAPAFSKRLDIFYTWLIVKYTIGAVFLLSVAEVFSKQTIVISENMIEQNRKWIGLSYYYWKCIFLILLPELLS